MKGRYARYSGGGYGWEIASLPATPAALWRGRLTRNRARDKGVKVVRATVVTSPIVRMMARLCITLLRRIDGNANRCEVAFVPRQLLLPQILPSFDLYLNRIFVLSPAFLLAAPPLEHGVSKRDP